MKTKFPYLGAEKKVTEEMCDLNGHMNVTFYTKIFEEGSYDLFNKLGMGFDYIESGFSTFTLEQNLRYVKENLLGDKISTHYRIVNVNRKLIHHVGILLNNDNELSAIEEILLIHIDMEKRKSCPMPDENFNKINELLLEHKVIFFRDQPLTSEQQILLAKKFGPLEKHAYVKGLENFPEIVRIKKAPEEKHQWGETWHTDVSYNPKPTKVIILKSVKIPPVGGDTMFSNMETAYDTLSDEMKEKIKDKKAVHSSLGAEAFVKKYKEMEGNGNLDEYSNIHPIVRVHPETGKKILYVNSMYTKQIIDMDKDESDKILKELFLHQERLDFTCRFKWTENAVAIWDNRSTLHQGLTDFFPGRGLGHERVMDRIAVEGDHPN